MASADLDSDPVLATFRTYLTRQNVTFSPLISPHRFPGRGLGIRANRAIKAGTKLIHVPTSAIVHKSSVRETSLRTGASSGLRPHALLAAYVAFVVMEEGGSHEAWVGTWPSLDDFRVGMPLLWPQKVKDVHVGERERFAVLPGGVTGRWVTLEGENVQNDEKDQKRFKGFLTRQSVKFYSDMLAINKALPEREIDVTDFFSPKNEQLIWAWCIVNSRCFYYFTSWNDKMGEGPPADADECMVLCPGMDLFNHTDENGCQVQYDRDGYDVLASQDYEAGEELFLNYGGHSDEELWVEYGFLLGDDNAEGNRWDGVRIDKIVLRGMSDAQVGALREVGYEGEYWLRHEGVCWRTEVAARMLVMERDEWKKFVLGRGREGNTPRGQKRKKGKAKSDQVPKLMVNGKIVEWLEVVKSEAESSLRGLGRLDKVSRWDMFALQTKSKKMKERPRMQARYEMVLKRWKQVDAICASALRSLEADYVSDGL